VNIDEIADGMPPFDLTDLDGSVRAFDELLAADDIAFNERQSICTGYIGGLTFAIAAFKEAGVELVAAHLEDRLTEWAKRGWID
jgi:hypothetical protein